MSETRTEISFPAGEARRIVKDLLTPNPVVYWLDFLLHVLLGWGAFVLTLNAETFSFQQGLFFLISSLALFRAMIFIHELTHLRKDSFKAFRIVWNVLCGFPLMVPSFIYQGVHNDHHNRNLYGTREDGEYFPFAVEGRGKIISFLLISFAAPVFFWLRFVFLAPFSYFHKNLRSAVLERASSLSVDLSYRRAQESFASAPGWRIQEAAAGLYGLTFVLLIIGDELPLAALILWYCISATIFFINSLRTLAAHRYRNPGSEKMSLAEQFQDSINITGNRLAVLWAPVGLRFHATHHLIPELPYHSIGEAHRRLMDKFSDKTLYEKVSCSGLSAALACLWREAGHRS